MLFADATQVTPEQCKTMLGMWENNPYDNSIPHKQFWCVHDDGCYEVIDNRDGDFFMESFKTPEAAHAWLRDVDTDICYHIDKMIQD